MPMRYVALVCDYDGTLAHDGRVDEATLNDLERALASGRKLVLVTGRVLPELVEMFPAIGLFEWVVAENGALLYHTSTHREKVLGEPPPGQFVQALRARRVEPLGLGRVIVATWLPQEKAVLEVIRDLGLDLQVIFNKGAVMVLPAGVNKWTGLRVALGELRLSPHNVVGIGDAENDYAFLRMCRCSVAVANAVPMLKERVDVVTREADGAGVRELAGKLVADDLKDFEPRLTRHRLLLGRGASGEPIFVPSVQTSILLAGLSGSGKSTFAAGLLERLAEGDYQFLLVDPEGDYQDLDRAFALGNKDREPTVAELMGLLEQPKANVVGNLVGMRVADRPLFLARLLPRLEELSARTGRPHWLVIDEAHHLLPSNAPRRVPAALPRAAGKLLITVHPDHVASDLLADVDVVVILGPDPERTLRDFSRAVGQPPPQSAVVPGRGEALVWFRKTDSAPFPLRMEPESADHRRHCRKYAEGELGSDKSFYFRGPEGKLNLRAQNLMFFIQLAEGVDDATWLYHLRRADYSGWLRNAIKDDELASAVAHIEALRELSAEESRARIRAAIEQRYTGAA